MNTDGHRLAWQGALLAAAVLAAPNVLACSGVVAPLLTKQNTSMAAVAYCIAALMAALAMWVRIRRLGFSMWALYPGLLFVFHPFHWMGAAGDCAKLLRDSSLFIAALIAAGLAYELLRTAIRRPEPDDYSRRWALGVGIVLFLAAVVAWSLPWKLRPLPVQDSYMVSVDFNAIREAQQDYHEQHGTYASSFSALKEHGWRGDRLQASPQTGLASAALGGLNVEAKVVADGTDYGVIFRPVDWPKGGVWVQYLMTSDGTVYTREDPGDGGFLDSPPLNDPASNGWRKSEYLRAAAP
jgi:hypothetical protein